MNTTLKFAGGLLLGAALGAGLYLLVTKDSEEGIIHDIKQTINQAIEAGKLSAEERRRQLEQELGFSIDDEPEPMLITAGEPGQPAPPQSTPATTSVQA
jgi:hypothetical protein